MSAIKYMGYADVAKVEQGDKVGGRLSDGLTATLVFNKDNNWVVDTDELGLSEDEVGALLEADPDRFKDVTGLKRVPSNLHQRAFLGHGASQVQVDQTSEQTPSGEVPEPPAAGLGGGAGGVTAGPEPVGGSTKGRARG
jgi:hypothetical protein